MKASTRSTPRRRRSWRNWPWSAPGRRRRTPPASRGISSTPSCAGHPSHGLRLVPKYCELAGTPGHKLDAVPASRRGPRRTHRCRCRGRSRISGPRGRGRRGGRDALVPSASVPAAVIRCGHAGRAGAWVERAVDRGAVGIVLLGGADPPFVMASGPGSVASLHTNPIAIGVPADGPPLILDMATSLVAEGKVAIASSRGTALPDGAIVDRDGSDHGRSSGILRRRRAAPVRRPQGLWAVRDGRGPLRWPDRGGSRRACRGRARHLPGRGRLPPRERGARVRSRRFAPVSTRRDESRDVLAPGEPEARARADLNDPGRDVTCWPAFAASRHPRTDGRLSETSPVGRGQSLGLASIRAPRVCRSTRRRICRSARAGQRDRVHGRRRRAAAAVDPARRALGPARRGRNRDVARCRAHATRRRLDGSERRLRKTDRRAHSGADPRGSPRATRERAGPNVGNRGWTPRGRRNGRHHRRGRNRDTAHRPARALSVCARSP